MGWRALLGDGMTDAKADTVLRRKAEAGRPRPDQFAMSSSKALRQSLTRAAQDLMAMPLSVSDLSETRMSLSELPEALKERSLLVVVEGPCESLGLVTLSPELLAGLVEKLTMGRLGAGEVAARRPTRTDAAMMAEFIDHVLCGLEVSLAAEPDAGWSGGYRYASWLEDPRPLPLILEETNYRLFRIQVELGTGGARKGEMLLALPATGRGPDRTMGSLPAPGGNASAPAPEAGGRRRYGRPALVAAA